MFFAISVLFVGVVLGLPLNVQNYKLIARQPDAQQTGSGPAYGYFSSTMKSTGIENERYPWDSTYSVIGKLDSTKYLFNGKYTFKLFYDYRDGTSVSITFKQSSWITTSGIPQGFEITLEPGDTPQSSGLGCAELKGLGLSEDPNTYIDGNGIDGCWFNSIGSTSAWNGGIPGYNNNVVGAKSMALYIYEGPNARCEESYECYDSGIDTTGSAYCYGYHSCGQASIKAVNNILCNGYRGCYEASEIQSDNYIYCYGADGCRSSNNIFGEYIYCLGSTSCMGVLEEISGTQYVGCSGYQGCDSANIITSNTVSCDGSSSCRDLVYGITTKTLYLRGYYALSNSNVYNFPNEVLRVYSDGSYSGYQGSIYCRNNAPYCTISCAGNGCNGLKVYYADINKVYINPPDWDCKNVETANSDCPTLLLIE